MADRYAEHLENTFQPNEGGNILAWKYCVGPEGRHISSMQVTQEIKENINSRN